MSFEEPTRNVVEDVIGILKRFSQHANDDPSHETEVFKHDAREKLENFISERREITLVLPAFPWKNRNIEKVIGRHPDLGEELGLARLNHLCEEIRKVYMFGARVHLIADGPVYNAPAAGGTQRLQFNPLSTTSRPSVCRQYHQTYQRSIPGFRTFFAGAVGDKVSCSGIQCRGRDPQQRGYQSDLQRICSTR
ncbi:Pyoverdine biosynthesis [Macrophomina phaseolina MS6]|uniref:Pyoverdine biosynthesis n=1 Tax=Macrophomina phaseolina (strain MS6) TaxID=1126212 RepID=K2R2A2_MACPH|nr:Pyoverdine biosynthesis [Macrophomina phaseolina MS6]